MNLKFKLIWTILTEDILEALLMIDAIQHLGIDYHFHGEIEVLLQRLYTKFNMNDCDNDLYELALGFRLLRQEGYYVSAVGIFFSFLFFCLLKSL